jgi:arylsulfatase A-like enzyme
MHRQFGLVILNGPAIKQGVKIEGANIIDIFPTILTTLDTPIPDDIDGRPLLEALQAEKAKTIKWVSAEGEEGSTRKEANYTDEEVSQIEDRLRKLGYLG